eukprot:7358021-Lingulodinium_polyedra.AAC.1
MTISTACNCVYLRNAAAALYLLKLFWSTLATQLRTVLNLADVTAGPLQQHVALSSTLCRPCTGSSASVPLRQNYPTGQNVCPTIGDK